MGSQNAELHTGRGGYLEFYQHRNLIRSLQAIQAAINWMNGPAIHLKSRISAIEPVNEPHISDDTSFRILWSFCRRAYEIIHQSPFQVPIIDSDGFRRLEDWKGLFPNNANFVVDYHIYYAFNTNSNLASIQDDICEKIHSISNYHLPCLLLNSI